MSTGVPDSVLAWYPTGCTCYRCDAPTWTTCLLPERMSLCPECGDKRCPGATDHTLHPAEEAT